MHQVANYANLCDIMAHFKPCLNSTAASYIFVIEVLPHMPMSLIAAVMVGIPYVLAEDLSSSRELGYSKNFSYYESLVQELSRRLLTQWCLRTKSIFFCLLCVSNFNHCLCYLERKTQIQINKYLLQ